MCFVLSWSTLITVACLLSASCRACCNSQHSAGMFPCGSSIHTHRRAAHAHHTERKSESTARELIELPIYRDTDSDSASCILFCRATNSALLKANMFWSVEAPISISYWHCMGRWSVDLNAKRNTLNIKDQNQKFIFWPLTDLDVYKAHLQNMQIRFTDERVQKWNYWKRKPLAMVTGWGKKRLNRKMLNLDFFEKDEILFVTLKLTN